MTYIAESLKGDLVTAYYSTKEKVIVVVAQKKGKKGKKGKARSWQFKPTEALDLCNALHLVLSDAEQDARTVVVNIETPIPDAVLDTLKADE